MSGVNFSENEHIYVTLTDQGTFLKKYTTAQISSSTLETLRIAWLPSLSVWKFRDNELENWCHTHFCTLDVDRPASVGFLF